MTKGSDEIDALMADLAAAIGSGRRDAAERHADFRKVFLGSDAGKRVLHDILAIGHIYATAPIRETNRTMEWLGERNLALMVLAIIYRPPKEKPGRQVSKKESNDVRM